MDTRLRDSSYEKFHRVPEEYIHHFVITDVNMHFLLKVPWLDEVTRTATFDCM
jgi:hypothetical protein